MLDKVINNSSAIFHGPSHAVADATDWALRISIGSLVVAILTLLRQWLHEVKIEERLKVEENPRVELTPKISYADTSMGHLSVHLRYLTGKATISFIHPRALYEKAGWIEASLVDMRSVILTPESNEADLLIMTDLPGDELIGLAVQDNKGDIHYSDSEPFDVPQEKRTLLPIRIVIDSDPSPHGRRKTTL